jgi:hypothetical protein
MADVFPEIGSIPPVCFYNFGGLATYLNHNPELKNIEPFRTYVLRQAFGVNLPFLEMNLISTFGVSGENIPICPAVATLSYNQSLKYNNQMMLFQKVYAYNSNAYVNASTMGWPNVQNVAPTYYKFLTYNEYNEYKASVGLINKLYPLNLITDYWSIPFPV